MIAEGLLARIRELEESRVGLVLMRIDDELTTNVVLPQMQNLLKSARASPLFLVLQRGEVVETMWGGYPIDELIASALNKDRFDGANPPA
jgi:hypothetical protein